MTSPGTPLFDQRAEATPGNKPRSTLSPPTPGPSCALPSTTSMPPLTV